MYFFSEGLKIGIIKIYFLFFFCGAVKINSLEEFRTRTFNFIFDTVFNIGLLYSICFVTRSIGENQAWSLFLIESIDGFKEIYFNVPSNFLPFYRI
jgi:hypothetical protein